ADTSAPCAGSTTDLLGNPTLVIGGLSHKRGGDEASFDGTTVSAYFTSAAPSCPGATYSFVVSGLAGALNWTTDQANTYATYTDPTTGQQTVDPGVTAAVSTTSGGATTITFTGDGLAQVFHFRGTAANYSSSCVDVAGEIAVATHATDSGPTVAECLSGGSGGGGFW